MKKRDLFNHKRKQVALTNPLNSEIWYCKDYDNVKVIDGINYITVFKAENEKRTFLMRKDALKLSKSFENV